MCREKTFIVATVVAVVAVVVAVDVDGNDASGQSVPKGKKISQRFFDDCCQTKQEKPDEEVRNVRCPFTPPGGR